MKICMLANSMSIHAQRWAKAFAKRGHEVHLLSINNYDIDGVSVHPVNIGSKNPDTLIKKFFSYLLLLLTAGKRIRQLKPDVVNAHYAMTHGIIAAFAACHPLIISIWGSDVIRNYKRLTPKLWRLTLYYALKKADLICSTSKFMTDKTLEIIKPFGKIEQVPFGVDCRLFKPAEKPKEYSGQFRIGFVKTLARMYGPIYLIKAMQKICQNVPNARLIMVGKGPMKDKLQNLSSKLGIFDRVEFTGFIPHDQLPQMMQSFDVLVNPSIVKESFGVAILEAQACGLPVIATRVGGVPEVCLDQKTGFLVPPRNSDALAEKTITLEKDTALRQRMSINARNFVLQNYRWEDNVEKMLRLFKQQTDKVNREYAYREIV